MLLFTPPSSSSSCRYHIKKSLSDRSGKSSTDLSPSPTATHLSASSNSDISAETTPKKTSGAFHFFDSILTRSASKPLSIRSMHQKSPTRTSSSSCPQTSLLSTVQLPSQARCLYHYNAIKDDEICIHRGEYVQVMTVDEENRWMVRRAANRTSPAVQGWLPGFVLGLKYPHSPTNKTLSPSVLPAASLSSNSLHHL